MIQCEEETHQQKKDTWHWSHCQVMGLAWTNMGGATLFIEARGAACVNLRFLRIYLIYLVGL